MNARKNKKINLQKLIENNYDAMKNNTYEWSDEETQAVYNLVGAYIKNKKFVNQGEKEDFVQNLAFLTICKYIKGYNLESGVKVSSFLNKCYENEYKLYLRCNDTKLQLSKVSLDEPVSNTQKLKDGEKKERIDMIKDEHTQHDSYVMDKWTKFLNEEYAKSYFLKDVVQNGYTQLELAKKYGCTQQTISSFIAMEKDIIILRIFCRNIDIPEKYNAEFESMLDKIDNHIKNRPYLRRYNTVQKLEEYYSKKMKNVAKRYGIMESPVEQVIKTSNSNKSQNKKDAIKDVDNISTK